MSCRRSAVINVSTLGASIDKLPENFHLAQLYAYRSSKVTKRLAWLNRSESLEMWAKHMLISISHASDFL